MPINGLSNFLNLATPTAGMQVTASTNLSGGVTEGDAINIAVDFLPGTAHGTESDVLLDGSNQAYGAEKEASYDGTNYQQTSLPQNQPGEFSSSPQTLDPNTFASWHSAYQAEYLKKFQAAPGAEVDIGSGATTIHAILAGTADRVIILDNLQKTDFAKMSTTDQTNVANSAFFTSVLSERLNLTTDSSGATAAINSLVDKINNAPTANSSNLNAMSAEDKQPFIDELGLITKHMGNMQVFSLQDIATQVSAISKRYDRAAAFAAQQIPAPNLGHPGFYSNSIIGQVSTDNNATIRSGYQNMIAQEKQIRDVAVAADSLVQSAAISNKKLDAPTMIFYFQLSANLSQEAEINANTEEVKQLNALLNLYSQMQGLVQKTLETFDDKSDSKRTLLNVDSADQIPNNDKPSSRLIMSIFEDAEGTGQHPLEALYGIKKPTFDMIYNTNGLLDTALKDSWNSFNGSLSNAVTQLNQQTQILMDGINSTTKEKDRHFDLGNNALSKMSDIIQTIGRGLS